MNRAIEAEATARGRFVRDAGEHPITVVHDEGLYRHLLFRAAGSLDWFEVITWPGSLTINGGHGTWTFSRTEDMFEFFRSSRGLSRINPQYWGEKVRGGLAAGNRLTEEYDADEFLAQVAEYVDERLEDSDWPDDVITDLRQKIADDVTDDYNDWTHEAGARELLASFDFQDGPYRFRFHDVWEWDLCVPSSHFLWSCWAVAYAVAAYDRHIAEQAVAS